MLKKFIFLILIFSSPIFMGVCSAELHSQSKGLFWLDVPEGWVWQEMPQEVIVSDTAGKHTIHISFEVYDKIEGQEMIPRIVEAEQAKVVKRITSEGGKTAVQIPRKVDGVPVVQMGFLLPRDEGWISQGTSLVFFNKGHLFKVYFEAPYEIQRLDMERIFDTFRFEKPQELESDSGTSTDNPLEAKEEGNEN